MSTQKIVTLEALRSSVAAAKKEGRVIGLANGAFDLLHVGHVRYLQGAKALVDCLVVAVNSDDSVRRLKGNGRPIVPHSERAELVAALACSDFVVVFDELNVRHIISDLRPDFHIKGTDYSPDSVPEREVVEAYGGKVAIAGDPKNHSTSEIVGRLK